MILEVGKFYVCIYAVYLREYISKMLVFLVGFFIPNRAS